MAELAGLRARLLVTPAIGFAADRLERHRGVMLLLIGCGLASILALAGTREFWPMLLLAVAFLVSIQTVLPLAETVALAAVRTASIDYGPVRLWGSIAFIGAGYVGGALLEASGPGAILWLLAGGTAAMAMTAYFLPSPRLDPISGEPSATGRERLTVAAVARVIGAPAFLLVLVAAGAVQASHAVYYAFGVLHWRSIGYSGGAIASLWAIGVVVEVGLFAFSRRLWER